MTLTSTPVPDHRRALCLGRVPVLWREPRQRHHPLPGQLVPDLDLQLDAARGREKEIGGSGGSLEPPGPLLTHLHTAYMANSGYLPTRLNPRG